MPLSNQISNQVIRQIFLILIITLLGGIIFWQLQTFLPAFLGAYTLYVLSRKWMFKLTTRLKGRSTLAAILLMISSFLIILVPLNGLIGILSSRIIPTIKRSNDIWATVEKTVQSLEEKYNIHILTQENIRNLGDWGITEVQKIVGATFNSLLIVCVMYFILFFMLTEARSMEKSMNNWLPLRPESIALVKKSLNNLVFSNAIGIPLVALLQGVVAFFGYWLAGVPEPFIWFIATCVAAVIPVLGSALVYVPLAILLFANGLMVQSAGLFLYGFLIVGSVDNLFRFWLQNKIGDTHPLITIFGVIVGLNIFGFMGLVFGPILIFLFLLLMQIYRREFHSTDNQTN
jgi:predicted PurR-regulated permease PerM